jgi:hypothetical protein
MSKPLTILDHAIQSITKEMFKNGPEEGCRIWEDHSNALTQAVVILHRASMELRMPGLMEKRAEMLEQIRREESSI